MGEIRRRQPQSEDGGYFVCRTVSVFAAQVLKRPDSEVRCYQKDPGLQRVSY